MTALHISQGGYCSTAARLLTALGGRAVSVEDRALPLTMGPPDCGLWPSALSSPPFAPVMICQSECSSAHFQTKLWLKTLDRCPLTHSLWRKLPLGSAQERCCWVCEPFCSNNSSSHSALNGRAGCQIPSHEPDNDPTGRMDHVTLTLQEKLRFLVTQLTSDGARLEVSSVCLGTYIPTHDMLVLSLLLWKSVVDVKLCPTLCPHSRPQTRVRKCSVRGPRTSEFHPRLDLLYTTLEYLISPPMQPIVDLQITWKETGERYWRK